MDKIMLLGLEFHGFHGVFEEEAKFGARFIVDAELFVTHLPSEDKLSETVDYSKVYDLIRYEVTEQRYRLIEALANTIAERILLEQPKVKRLTVRVHKPHAPLPGVIRDVVVELTRPL